jgi:hypothetical protein
MAVDAAGNIYLASAASMTNAGGDKTTDLLTVILRKFVGVVPPSE